MASAPRRALELYPLRQDILFGGEKGYQNAPEVTGVPARDVDFAKKLEGYGLKAEDIFNQSGWYRGPDQRWKWILSDEQAKLKDDAFIKYFTSMDMSDKSKAEYRLKNLPEGTRKLSDILDHPNLFVTYPQFKDIIVKLEKNPEAGGSYDADKNIMYIRDDARSSDILNTILHELQHGIQSVEGFGLGGNMAEFYPQDVKAGKRPITEAEQKLARSHRDRIAGETEADQVEKQFRTRNWSRMPTQLENFPAAADQYVRQPPDYGTLTRGKAYQQPADPAARWEPVEITPKWADEQESWDEVDFDPFAKPYADQFARSINRNLPRQIPGQDRVIRSPNSYNTEAPVYYGDKPPGFQPLPIYPLDKPPVYMYDPENPERAQSVENPAAPVMEEGPTPRLYGPDPSYIDFKPGQAIPVEPTYLGQWR